MKIFIVTKSRNTENIIDSVHRFRSNANSRRFEILSEGEYLTAKVIEKELE